jgi:hypothetical protein
MTTIRIGLSVFSFFCLAAQVQASKSVLKVKFEDQETVKRDSTHSTSVTCFISLQTFSFSTAPTAAPKKFGNQYRSLATDNPAAFTYEEDNKRATSK